MLRGVVGGTREFKTKSCWKRPHRPPTSTSSQLSGLSAKPHLEVHGCLYRVIGGVILVKGRVAMVIGRVTMVTGRVTMVITLLIGFLQPYL